MFVSIASPTLGFTPITEAALVAMVVLSIALSVSLVVSGRRDRIFTRLNGNRARALEASKMRHPSNHSTRGACMAAHPSTAAHVHAG